MLNVVYFFLSVCLTQFLHCIEKSDKSSISASHPWTSYCLHNITTCSTSIRNPKQCPPLSHRLFNGLNGLKIENQGKQSMLVFFNVSEEDYGNYTCVAMNNMGITNASIILYGKSMCTR